MQGKLLRVKNLIDELQKQDPEAIIVGLENYGFVNLTKVRASEHLVYTGNGSPLYLRYAKKEEKPLKTVEITRQ